MSRHLGIIVELDGAGERKGLLGLEEVRYYIAKHSDRSLKMGDRITTYVARVDKEGNVQLSLRPVGKTRRQLVAQEVKCVIGN